MPSAKPNKSQAKLYRFDEQVYQSLKEQKFVLDLWGVILIVDRKEDKVRGKKGEEF